VRAVLFSVLVAASVIVAPGGVLPAGTRLSGRMNTAIGTTRSVGVFETADAMHAGAPFAATIDAAVVDEHGRTRLPPGAILRGHITKIAAGEGTRRAVVELAIDRLENRPLAGRVIEAEVQQLPSSDAGAQVDTTSFWGMVVGGVAFGIPGVAIGHAFGGGVGAVNATRARRVEGWIAAGSLITVELDEPLRVDACVAARAGAPAC
jgi:hypothetical protein